MYRKETSHTTGVLENSSGATDAWKSSNNGKC